MKTKGALLWGLNEPWSPASSPRSERASRTWPSAITSSCPSSRPAGNARRARRDCATSATSAWVAVIGTGGVGVGALQGACIAGARRIFAVDPYEWKQEQALKFGATAAFADVDSAAADIAQATRGFMCHKVIVTVGHVEGKDVESWMGLTAKGGVCCLTGMAGVLANDVTLNLAGLSLLQKRLQGSIFGAATRNATSPRSSSSRRGSAQPRRHGDPRVLAQINDGYRDMLEGRNIRGVIRYTDADRAHRCAASRTPARNGHNGLMTTRPLAVRDATPQLAYRVAAMLLGIGTLHFVAPKPFDSIIPVELPGSPRLYTYGSGVAELAIGALLVPRRTRRAAALAAAVLFVGVFPGNVNMCRLWWDRPWPMRILALARLPLQIPMVTTALKIRRNS